MSTRTKRLKGRTWKSTAQHWHKVAEARAGAIERLEAEVTHAWREGVRVGQANGNVERRDLQRQVQEARDEVDGLRSQLGIVTRERGEWEPIGKTTITELVGQAYGHARKSGFHDDAPDSLDGARSREWLASKLALIHSEASEALEEVRENDHPLSAYHREDGKPEGFASELADIVIRVADLAGATGIDLEGAITEKLEYNKSRPAKHGKHL